MGSGVPERVAGFAVARAGSGVFLLEPARVGLVAAWERAAAVVAGHQQPALAAVAAACEAVGLDGDAARFEVGAALRLSAPVAYQRTRVARELVGRLAGTLAALRAGRVSYLQARAVAEAVRDLDDRLAARVQARVLARAADQSLAETRRALRRAVLAADPAAAERRLRDAHAGRAVTLEPLADGMAGLWATLSAPDAAQAYDTLTHRARAAQRALRRAGGADPGLDALRADTLLALLTGRPLPAPDPTAAAGPAAARAGLGRCTCGGRRATAVIIDLATLLGLAEHPGELPGLGPIPASLARALAADTDWTRFLTDPGTGRLLDAGAGRYRPSPALTRHVIAAHRECGFPACTRPAAACDLDHVIEFRTRRGHTVPVNLGPLCRTHHNAKTHGRWHLSYDPHTGIKTWTSPLGLTHTKDPPRYPPDG